MEQPTWQVHNTVYTLHCTVHLVSPQRVPLKMIKRYQQLNIERLVYITMNNLYVNTNTTTTVRKRRKVLRLRRSLARLTITDRVSVNRQTSTNTSSEQQGNQQQAKPRNN